MSNEWYGTGIGLAGVLSKSVRISVSEDPSNWLQQVAE